ncbi:uncharacterized protein LOC113547801 [Rhopalosiphum maidis]|uniref:uncharacterized protein LOC113547801 n=1 Tax=Rhopalosiphum maidis TaxID=43146 RepID=UPI000F003257|nr:uncharacterized protein LOC113547801 [Rhopalosiphum maidis]
MANISPLTQNSMGKPISSAQRIMIVNLYKMELKKNPNITVREARIYISKLIGIGRRTVSNVIREYNANKTVISPCKTRIMTSFKDKFDDLQMNAVRLHVHSFWFNKKIPTLDKILQVIKDDYTLPNISGMNLHRLLKSMDFVYTKHGRNSAVIEKDKIVLWRRRYLENIRKYREEGRHLYYLGETWVNAGDCTSKTWVDRTIKSPRDAFLQGLTTESQNPSGKDKRLIVLHIGSEDGFVPGGLLCFESKKTMDYHAEINGDTFYDWMTDVIPRLKENCVIIMDNAPYHSVKKEKIPNTTTKKADIIKWLQEKGEVIDRPMVIPQLLDIVKRLRPQYNKYLIDDLAVTHNRTILRLPPYHYELNPIELAWANVKDHVKKNNTSYKLSDVKTLLLEGIERVDEKMWKNFIRHTMKEEKKFYKIDFIIEDMLSAETQSQTMTVGDTSSDSEFDSE